MLILLKYLKFLKCHKTPPDLAFFEYFSSHGHFHYVDVMSILLFVSSTNSSLSYHLEAFFQHALFRELLHR